MLTGLVQHASKVKYLVNENSTTLLSAAGVVGTVATAYLTGRATFKAAELIAKQEEPKPVTKIDKTKIIWPLYIPPVAVGSLTIASIIMAHRLSSKKIAALVIASGVSERAFQEYKDKVVEKLGVRQDQKIRDEVAQDRVTGDPTGSREIVLAGTGEVLCYDMLTGRYFQSTVEEIKRAENRINYELIHYMSASLSMFYEEIGLPPTDYTDSVGWNLNNKMAVNFSTTMSQDNRPCLAISFSHPPTLDYDKTAWD
jgi:Family of unknown function (DUF6353)